jgi:hypothetical protein
VIKSFYFLQEAKQLAFEALCIFFSYTVLDSAILNFKQGSIDEKPVLMTTV